MWTALLFNRFTAAGLALAIAAAGFYAYRASLIQQGYDTAMAQVRERDARASQKIRDKELEMQDAADKSQREYDAMRKERDAAVVRADASGRRMRDAVGSASSCEKARTTSERKAADTAANMRAELLRGLDIMAGEISKFADDSHRAGLACEGLYGATK